MAQSRDVRAVLEAASGGDVLSGPFHGDMCGLRWVGVDADSATFTDVDFSDCDLTGSQFQDCEFTGCRFDGTKMADARFREASLTATSLAGAALPRARLDGVRFDTCDLSGVILSDSEVTDVKFVRSKLSYANFSVSAWWDVVVDGCPVHEVAFDGARFAMCGSTPAVSTTARSIRQRCTEAHDWTSEGARSTGWPGYSGSERCSWTKRRPSRSPLRCWPSTTSRSRMTHRRIS